jgi:hypothetical protein
VAVEASHLVEGTGEVTEAGAVGSRLTKRELHALDKV